MTRASGPWFLLRTQFEVLPVAKTGLLRKEEKEQNKYLKTEVGQARRGTGLIMMR